MPLKAYLSRSDANDGSFSRSLRVERLPSHDDTATGIRYAAKLLRDLEAGVPYVVGRTFHLTACEIEHDPHAVSTGWKAFDAQANRSGGFMTGNVSSNVQTSNYVRSYSAQVQRF